MIDGRVHEIDGIRGWAALVVLLFHFVWELFGDLFPVLRNPFTASLFDGSLAVYIFFILSGDALSTAYIRNFNNRVLVKMILKRYLRLTGPILMSCLMVWALMYAGLNFNDQAWPKVLNENWLGRFLLFDQSLMRAVHYGLIGVYTVHSVDVSYNPFAWPMSVELYGSFFIFGVLISLPYLKNKYCLIGIVSLYLLLIGSYYSLFFVGLFFSILRHDGLFVKLQSRFVGRYAAALLIFVFILNTIVLYVANRPKQVSAIFATTIVFLIYANPVLVKFFSSRVSKYLGYISFPLYLTHFVVLISFTSWAILFVDAKWTLSFYSAFWILVSSVLICIVVADLFARLEMVYLKKLDAIVARSLK